MEGAVEEQVNNQQGRVLFSWNIHYSCNYSCPYCWFYGKWEGLRAQNKYRPVSDLIKSWNNIHERYGSAHIEIMGGEPFIYPDFNELIKELSDVHTISITTNLSIDVQELLGGVNCSNLEIISTFHPSFADFNRFVREFLLLKDKGVRVRLTYLAYPPQIKLIKYYADKFNEQGIQFSLMTFWGNYNGINYPGAYTEEEKAVIMPWLGKREGEQYQLEPRNVKGNLCHAGERYAVIKPDGSTFRCGGDNPQQIGDFFCDNFKLLDQPLPCQSEFCPCNEWAFLLKED